MTSIDRFQDDLPATLIEIADERMPDYVDDLLGQTAAMRQRPAWAFPGRWLPMADLVANRRFAPRLPLRALAVAALVALLIGGAIWFAGSQRRRVPAPFGPAANGVIAYATGGDLYTADATGNGRHLLLGGSEEDGSPLFSPDGLRVAFLRARPSTAFDLMVVGLDGTSVRALSTRPLVDGASFQWAPDSRFLIVPYPNGDLVRYDADGGPPLTLAHLVDVDLHAFRPPDGRQIIAQRHGDATSLLLVNADGSGVTTMGPTTPHGDFEQARWSPDGSALVFGSSPDGSDQHRMFVMHPDGTGIRQLTSDTHRWTETDPVWSPDGTRIAFDRWLWTDGPGWVVQPIAIVTVASGALLETEVAPVSDGAFMEWSPDGRSLLSIPGPHIVYGATNSDPAVLIDPTTGKQTSLSWDVVSTLSWQRTAP